MPDYLSFHLLNVFTHRDRLFIQGLKALSKQNVEHKLVDRLDANSFPHELLSRFVILLPDMTEACGI